MSAQRLGPRVADFSTHLSGPIASRHLAQLGADVIKIENPKWGDGNRDFPPYFHGEGIHHLSLNPGTRSLAIDAKSADWRGVVEAVARWADVVIVGNRPTNARRLGIDVASLLAINPQLTYCLITGYGIEGEWAGLPAHGLNMDAFAGTVPLDWKDGIPDIPEHYRSVGTTMAGVEAALGIYAALYRRTHGGGGQIVHVSIWEAALSCMWRDAATHANVGRQWTPYRELGSRYAVYATSDGRALLVCPIEKHFWERFCDVLALPAEVRARGDWSSGSDMGPAYVALGEQDLIQSRIALRPRDEWLALLAQADVPAAPILDWREAMSSPHAAANGAMASYEYRGRTVRVPTIPVSVTGHSELAPGADPIDEVARAHRERAARIVRPPYLGEHNERLLRELGVID